MPSEGQSEGQGTGFSYIADAETATIVISFDEVISTPVTATAHDLDETRTVIITEQTENSVTLHIEGFAAGNPTIVEFKTVQSENA